MPRQIFGGNLTDDQLKKLEVRHFAWGRSQNLFFLPNSIPFDRFGFCVLNSPVGQKHYEPAYPDGMFVVLSEAFRTAPQTSYARKWATRAGRFIWIAPGPHSQHTLAAVT